MPRRNGGACGQHLRRGIAFPGSHREVPQGLSVFSQEIHFLAKLCSLVSYCVLWSATVFSGQLLCSLVSYCALWSATVLSGQLLCSLVSYCALRSATVLSGQPASYSLALSSHSHHRSAGCGSGGAIRQRTSTLSSISLAKLVSSPMCIDLQANSPRPSLTRAA
jgi:hypothetical protein